MKLFLSLFAFSSENWRRPPEEVNALMKLFATALKREAKHMREHGVRMRVAGDLTAKVTTGDVKLSGVTCRNLIANGTTGDIKLRQVIAAETFSIKCTTGDVSFDACDAASLSVKTTTGDITGTLLTSKVFDAHATTGRVTVPQTTEGGNCKLRATTGSIKISLK